VSSCPIFHISSFVFFSFGFRIRKKTAILSQSLSLVRPDSSGLIMRGTTSWLGFWAAPVDVPAVTEASLARPRESASSVRVRVKTTTKATALQDEEFGPRDDVESGLERGMDAASRRSTGEGRFASARYVHDDHTFMGPKGKLSSRYVAARQNDLSEERSQRLADTARRASARVSARRMHMTAALQPLITSRPGAQRWREQPDDWKYEKGQMSLHAHTLWDRCEAGLPPAAQSQVRQRLNGEEMSAKERAEQLERQLEIRERKRLAAEKAGALEAMAAEALAKRVQQLNWYHQQRARATAKMGNGERKEARRRLYATHVKPQARVYC
jgi:hypothetical protein